MKVPISGSRSRSPSQWRSTRSRTCSLAITDVPSRASQEAQGTRAVDLDGGAREEADAGPSTGTRPPARSLRDRPRRPSCPSSATRSGGMEARTQNVQRDPIVDQILGRGLRPRPQARPRGVRVGEVGDRLLDRLRRDEHDPAPACRTRRWGSEAWTSLIDASMFAFTASIMPSSVTSSARARGEPPALATTMSRRPNRSTVASTSRRGVAGSVTSAGSARISPGSSVRGLGEPFWVARADRDPASLGRERGRCAAPETLRGGGDERNLAVDPEVHGGRCYPWGLGSGPPSTEPRPERAWRVHKRSVVVLLASLALVGGCSRTKTLDANSLEEKLAYPGRAGQPRHARHHGRSCPDDEPAKAGATVPDANATSAAGTTLTIAVTQTDDQGNVTWKVDEAPDRSDRCCWRGRSC